METFRKSSKIKKLLITPVDYIEYPPEADANFDINILIAFDTNEKICDNRKIFYIISTW